MEADSWGLVKCKDVYSNSGMVAALAVFNDEADLQQEPHKNAPLRCGKSCKFCYCDDPDGGWLCPCKCSGSIKWVHCSCFARWLDNAPLLHKVQCTVCKYVYKKRWRLKPYSQWCAPDFTSVKIDVFRTILDGFFTYKLFNTCRNFLRGRRSVLAVLASLSFWRMLESVANFLEAKFGRLIRFAVSDPSAFIILFLTYVSPLMIFGAVLAWKLQKAIEREERSERRRAKISKMLHHEQEKKKAN
uniref:Small integral membrane protein 15 n=1 Tax=Syphacia muris TaxID=451379 RepID=A0A0N5AYR5_9BILA